MVKTRVISPVTVILIQYIRAKTHAEVGFFKAKMEFSQFNKVKIWRNMENMEIFLGNLAEKSLTKNNFSAHNSW